MRRFFYVFLVLEFLVLNACKNAFFDSKPDDFPPDNLSPYEEAITGILDLKNDGVMERIQAFQAEDTGGVFADVDMDKLSLFLNEPAEALKQVAEEENGEAQLAIIDALFNEGTVDDVLQAVEILSPEMAGELVDMLGGSVANV
jgi:hypothetical protein